MSLHYKLQASFILLTTLFFSHAFNVQAQSMQEDLHNRSSLIQWPKTHTPEVADLFAHNTIDIKAPCKKVWELLVNAPTWPNWYSNASDVKIADASPQLKSGAFFSWTTFNLQVESVVAECIPAKRLAWYGKAKDIDAYHTWFLKTKNNNCYVITEEVVKGEGAITLLKQDEGAMHRGHEKWLQQLKAQAEK